MVHSLRNSAHRALGPVDILSTPPPRDADTSRGVCHPHPC